ncbi:hypothetical protein ACXR6G_06245 [Ancylomarina sp. YFZ004]
MIRIISSIILIVVSFNITAFSANLKENEDNNQKRKWYLPRDAKIQYAGNIGFLSVGATYYLAKDWYRVSLMYGMASGRHDVETLNTVALKNTFLIKKFKIKDFTIAPTAGLSINIGSTHNTYRKLPEHFPDDYYFQNKIHFAPFFGAIVYHPLPFKTITGMDFYLEVGTTDNYLLEAIRTDYVKYSEIWNLALGLSFYF